MLSFFKFFISIMLILSTFNVSSAEPTMLISSTFNVSSTGTIWNCTATNIEDNIQDIVYSFQNLEMFNTTRDTYYCKEQEFKRCSSWKETYHSIQITEQPPGKGCYCKEGYEGHNCTKVEPEKRLLNYLRALN